MAKSDLRLGPIEYDPETGTPVLTVFTPAGQVRRVRMTRRQAFQVIQAIAHIMADYQPATADTDPSVNNQREESTP